MARSLISTLLFAGGRLGILGTLALALSTSAFTQDNPGKQGKTGLQYEVEFMKARNAIATAENASEKLLSAKIDLDTFRIKQEGLKNNEIFLLQAKVRLAEAKLVASGGFVDIELAKDKNRLETLLLNLATKESIEEQARLQVAYDLAMTDEVQRAKDRLKILENSLFSPANAAYRLTEQKRLEQTMTPEQRQVRSRVEAWRKQARLKIPDADRAEHNVKAIADRVRTAELTQSMQRVDALMKQASLQVK